MNDAELSVINSCEGCGACCLHMVHPPFRGIDEGNGDFARLSAALQQEVKTSLEGVTQRPWPTPCFWLNTETMQCTHYDDRPDTCRAYEQGGRQCRSTREYFAE